MSDELSRLIAEEAAYAEAAMERELLIDALQTEAQALRDKASATDDSLKWQLLFAEWRGLCRAIFLAKHPDRCQTPRPASPRR